MNPNNSTNHQILHQSNQALMIRKSPIYSSDIVSQRSDVFVPPNTWAMNKSEFDTDLAACKNLKYNEVRFFKLRKKIH